MFVSATNILVDKYEQLKQMIYYNQHFFNQGDLQSLKVEDDFNPQLAEDKICYLMKTKYPLKTIDQVSQEETKSHEFLTEDL